MEASAPAGGTPALSMEAGGILAPASSVPPPDMAAAAEKALESEEVGQGNFGTGSDAPHAHTTQGGGKDTDAPTKQNGNGVDTESSSDTRGSGNNALSPAMSFPQTPGWEESEGSRRRTESPLGDVGESGRSGGSPRAAAARKRQFRGFKRSPEACMALIREVSSNAPTMRPIPFICFRPLVVGNQGGMAYTRHNITIGYQRERRERARKQTHACFLQVLLRKPFSYGHVGPGWAAVADSLNSSFPDLFPPASDGMVWWARLLAGVASVAI